mmetsp:Transcript_39349/g.40084  ORF Transcript_39349/g.40084 Transcript_39349/m.40084 type:complete len:561 (+) Transcript_39349:91-1773(+)
MFFATSWILMFTLISFIHNSNGMASTRSSSKNFLTSPIRGTVNTVKFVRDGVYGTADFVKSVPETLKNIENSVQAVPQTVKGIQTKTEVIPKTLGDIKSTVESIPGKVMSIQSNLQAVPVRVSNKIDTTANDLTNVQKSIAESIEFTKKVLNPSYAKLAADEKKSAVDDKIKTTVGKVEKTYNNFMRVISPNTYINSFSNYQEQKEKEKQEMFLKRAIERKKRLEFQKQLINLKETVYVTIENVQLAQKEAILIGQKLPDDVDAIIAEIRSIPAKIQLMLDEIRALPDKVEANKKSLGKAIDTFQTDIENTQKMLQTVINDLKGVPKTIESSYVSTKCMVEEIPNTVLREYEEKKQLVLTFAAMCWRIITLEDVKKAFNSTQQTLQKTSSDIAKVKAMFQSKPKTVVKVAPIPQEKTVLQKSWEVLTVLTLTISSFFKGLGNLKARVDSELKRQEERERVYQQSRPVMKTSTPSLKSTAFSASTVEKVESVKKTEEVKEIKKPTDTAKKMIETVKVSQISSVTRNTIDRDEEEEEDGGEFTTTVIPNVMMPVKNSTMGSL